MLKSISKIRRKAARWKRRHPDALPLIGDLFGGLFLAVMGYILTVLVFCL